MLLLWQGSLQAVLFLTYNVIVNYQKHAIAGFSWQTLQRILTTGLSFLKIFILARLLGPEQFGLFSLVMIALGVTESITQTGVNITMLQSKQPIKYFLDTAFVIAIIRGFLIGSLMILMGYLMSNYYNEPSLFPMISIVALVPIIKGFINPAIISWQKNFQFARDSFYSSLRVTIEMLAQIVLALALHSVWALCLGVIVGALFEVTLSFLMLKERPVFHYIKSRGEAIFKNAKWLSLGSLLSYLNDNIDDFLLGKIVGTYQLGIYHNAYALSHKTNYELSKSAYHGVMPIFSKIAQENERVRLKRAFFKSMFSTLLIASLISLPLILFPKLLVDLILGEKWLEAINILPLLALAGLIHTVANMTYALIIAKKQYFYMNLHMIASLVLMILGIIYLGNIHGLVGAVLGIVLARAVALPIALLGVKKSLE
ncbi:MAG: Polysaccharide biosynthesis protein [Candidatus Pacebacteria bacterium GW2011_GWF2_38_9]|nr:MAG: polysaccharide biosynthesis protein, polysaccharide transporter, PST family [candidate division TM6 bacterium GW2011_GWF2_28_16]KKQ07350.1 MAG: Polysaccharide biosynthesis protein [Candidatus Pacebacteria bacterium GW2011_GWF1_36_5]KKQ88910.1 MAG: Polysaccharide biosynthesis protein [Candidatus Pacebacteria bacterium GW2011_GWF2_38_9]